MFPDIVQLVCPVSRMVSPLLDAVWRISPVSRMDVTMPGILSDVLVQYPEWISPLLDTVWRISPVSRMDVTMAGYRLA